jgi:CAAX prenyl protease-like protein
MSERAGHGWWPYLLPYVSFLVLVEVGHRVPDDLSPLMLVVKPLVPAALMLHYFRNGAYPELRGFRWGGGAGLDVLVGLFSAALWMLPFILFDSVRELMGVDPSQGFDPEQMGGSLVPLALSLRMLGFALVTPFFEELFIRSFVMRYSEIYPGPGDFRDLPLARFTLRSFLASTVIFTAGHLSWEWPVALAWISLTNLWFYRRGHLMSVVVVHAVANASILVFVALFSGSFQDGRGNPLPLWFFL